MHTQWDIYWTHKSKIPMTTYGNGNAYARIDELFAYNLDRPPNLFSNNEKTADSIHYGSILKHYIVFQNTLWSTISYRILLAMELINVFLNVQL